MSLQNPAESRARSDESTDQPRVAQPGARRPRSATADRGTISSRRNRHRRMESLR